MSIDRRLGPVALFPVALFPVALFLVAGCSKGVDMTNASIEDVAAAAAKVDRQKAGMWDVTTEVESLDLGAMGTAASAAQLKKQLGGRQSHSACLTDREASAVGIPGPGAMQGAANCRFDRFRMGGGALDATMRCDGPAGRLIVTQKGRYADTEYDLRSTVKQVSGALGTSMTMHVTGRRLGDCKRAG